MATEPDIWQLARGNKESKKNICIHGYCLQSFLAEIETLDKKPYILCVLKRETLTNV